jgi:hypothetical protein
MSNEEVEKIVSILKDSESYWNQTIEDLTGKLNCSAKDVVSLQAKVISSRQQLTEQIKIMSYKIYKLLPEIKSNRKKLFEYYEEKCPYKTNSTQKTQLIEWDMAKLDLKKDLYDTHVDFLKESLKNMDNINFAIKNKIILYQLTDLE